MSTISTDGKAVLSKRAFGMTYSVATNIKAPATTIWQVLTDAAEYPAWNSTVVRVEGNIVLGEKIKVFAKISPDRAFPVEVSELTADKKMVWSGGMPLGLFKGVREFVLSPQGDGSVDFSMKENFSGLMAPVIGSTMPDLRPAFEDFAADLKQQAESRN